MSPRKEAKESSRRTTREKGFSDEERSAMKERAAELKAEKARKRGGKKADGEADLLAKIAEMPEPDHGLATRIHSLVKEVAPNLSPKTWYGMPAYARDGKVVCFFQGAAKFQSRYATFNFTDASTLDDGDMWETSFAVTKIGPAEEKRIRALLEKAVA